MRQYFYFLLLLGICGCDSPMNNRVNEPQNKAQQSISLRFESLALNIKTVWLAGPEGSINFNNKLLVILTNEQGDLTDLPNDTTLQFYSTMPSMGHPMDDAGTFVRMAKGLYLNDTIKYNMPGDWLNELWILDQNFQTVDAVRWLEFF